MKRLILLVALAISTFGAKAQIDTAAMYAAQVDTMTVEFTAPIGTVCYAAYYVNDPAIILQVALATSGANFTDSLLSDDSATATLGVKGSTIIKCFRALKLAPEGYAADENKKLLTALMPAIMSSPALAYVIGKMRDTNATMVQTIKRNGANKVIDLQKILD
jgi:hypothetical protein